MGFKPVQNEFPHNFVQMTDEVDNNGQSPIRIFLEVRCKTQTLVHKGAYTKGAYLI